MRGGFFLRARGRVVAGSTGRDGNRRNRKGKRTWKEEEGSVGPRRPAAGSRFVSVTWAPEAARSGLDQSTRGFAPLKSVARLAQAERLWPHPFFFFVRSVLLFGSSRSSVRFVEEGEESG